MKFIVKGIYFVLMSVVIKFVQGIFLSVWRTSYRIVAFHEKFRFETICEALTSFRVCVHSTC